jgi:heme exporter protein C
MLRAYVADGERGARFAAVFGIIGFIDVPIVYLSIRWWRTLHPSPVVSRSGLTGEMLLTLMVCLAAFTFLFATLLLLRYHSARLGIELEKIKSRLYHE